MADHGATVVSLELEGPQDNLRVARPFEDEIRGPNLSSILRDFTTPRQRLSLNRENEAATTVARRLIDCTDVHTESFTLIDDTTSKC